jgi:hypothetical protein
MLLRPEGADAAGDAATAAGDAAMDATTGAASDAATATGEAVEGLVRPSRETVRPSGRGEELIAPPLSAS